MSELYALLKDRDPLEKAMVYAVIKKVNEKDVNNNKTNNINRAINAKCEELGLEGLKQEIFQRVTSLRSPFWRDRNDLSKEVDQELVKENIIKGIVSGPHLQEMKTDTLIRWAQILALVLVAEELKTAQIRKFLSGVRGVEAKVKRNAPEDFSRQDVAFLKVHLAYAKARQQASVKPLMEVMTAVIDRIREEGKEGLEDFEVFVRFVEAVVAYHRFYGGED
jgi:CRISPR-associated protein Csm2